MPARFNINFSLETTKGKPTLFQGGYWYYKKKADERRTYKTCHKAICCGSLKTLAGNVIISIANISNHGGHKNIDKFDFSITKWQYRGTHEKEKAGWKSKSECATRSVSRLLCFWIRVLQFISTRLNNSIFENRNRLWGSP
jgi:hypothetical protein